MSFVNVIYGRFQSVNDDIVLLCIIPQSGMQCLLCQTGTVYLYGRQTIQCFHNRFIGYLQCFLNTLALYKFCRHGARRNCGTAAKGFEN